MLNQMQLQNWLRVTIVALAQIFLLLTLHASSVLNLSFSQVLVVSIMAVNIAMIVELSSLKNQTSKS